MRDSSHERRKKPVSAIRPTAVKPPADAKPPMNVNARTFPSAARTFLNAHWIHLILFLAMLLIVVGTTVGAYYLLGQTLMQPAPIAGLGLFYILAFWGLGESFIGLGAPRAGRVTLAATIFLIPINFIVARDLVLRLDANAAGYVLLLGALIMVSIRILPGVLRTTRTAYFAVTFCGLCAINAFVQPQMPFRPGFALFLIAAWFAASIWRSDFGQVVDAEGRPLRFSFQSLGLLTYAYLIVMLRAAFSVQPAVNLYSVPLMLTAIACVRLAHYIPLYSPREPKAYPVNLLQGSGYIMAVLAFVLAAQWLPENPTLFYGNALATAVFALGLFLTLLRLHRKLIYFCFSFVAFSLMYLSVFYFSSGLLSGWREIIQRVFQFDHGIPLGFRSFHGVLLSALLAVFAYLTSRTFREKQFEQHGHYIGVALSVAAVGISLEDTRAAFACLAAYGILYAIEAWIFSAPILLYLSCAGFIASAGVGSTLIPGMSLVLQGAGAAYLAAMFWIVSELFRRSARGSNYIAPPTASSAVLSGIAIAAGVYSLVTPPHVSYTGASIFAVIGLLCIWAGSVYPNSLQRYTAVLFCNVAFVVTLVRLEQTLGLGLRLAEWGFAISLAGLFVFLCGRLIGSTTKFASTSQYASPLYQAALLYGAVAIAAGTRSLITPPHASYTTGVLFALTGLLCVWLGSVYRNSLQRYMAVLFCNVGFVLTLVRLEQQFAPGFTLAQWSAGISLAGLFVFLCGRLISPVAKRYVFPLCHAALLYGGVGVVFCVTVLERFVRTGNFQLSDVVFSTVALASTAIVLFLTSVFAYTIPLYAYLTGWTTVAALIVGARALRIYMGWQRSPAHIAAGLSILALFLYKAGEKLHRDTPQEQVASLYSRVLLRTAFMTIGAVWVLCIMGWEDHGMAAIATAMTAVTLVFATDLFPNGRLAYFCTAIVLAAWIATFQELVSPPIPLQSYAPVLALFGLVVLAVGQTASYYRGQPERSRWLLWIETLRVFSLNHTCITIALVAALMLAAPKATAAVFEAIFIGGAVLLWQSWLRRSTKLVYAGIAAGVTGVLVSTVWYFGQEMGVNGPQFGASPSEYLALYFGQAGMGVNTALFGVASSFCALSLWGIGSIIRRRVDVLFWTPCFQAALCVSGFAGLCIVGSLMAVETNVTACVAGLSFCAISFVLLNGFHQRQELTYLGIASGVGAIYVQLWATPFVIAGRTVAYSVAASLISLMLYTVAFGCRRKLVDADIYGTPILVSSLAMTVPVFLLIPQTDRLLSTISLGLLSLVYLLMTTEWKTQVLVYAGVGVASAAVCVQIYALNGTLFGQPYGYGLAAAMAAVALWVTGFLNEWAGRNIIYSNPLFNSSLLLILLAVTLAFASPAAMALAGMVFLLMVRSMGGARWLYPALGSAGCAVYFAFFGRFDERAGTASLIAVFVLIILSFVVKRFRPTLCAWCDVKEAGFEMPPANLAFLASFIPVALYVNNLFSHPLRLWPFLGLFYLMMIKAYPHPVWVHLSVASFSWSLFTVGALYADLRNVRNMLLLAFVMALAYLWLFVQRGFARIEPAIRRAAGIADGEYAAVFGQWSLVAFAFSAIFPVAFCISVATTVGLSLPNAAFWVTTLEVFDREGWWLVFATLIMVSAYIVMRWPAPGVDRLILKTHPFLVLLVWWLIVPLSPFSRLNQDPRISFAALTSALGIITIALAIQRQTAWRKLAQEGENKTLAGIEPYGSVSSFILSVLALAATHGAQGWSILLALFGITVVSGGLVRLTNAPVWAYIASAGFTVLCLYSALQIGTMIGSVLSSRLLLLGLAAIVACFLLMGAAIVLGRTPKGKEAL